eukprot:c9354_g1_i1.p1 GENE.c9354_g1_i1~~c9354_g1_i1.p1  ORF type:complete len:562 (-),score=143.55 c9354_g1_i1:48-1700(-)
MPKLDGDLVAHAANYAPLTPISFLKRTVAVFPTYKAMVHGRIVRTWGEEGERCARLAKALIGLGVKEGDVVSVLAPNIPEMFELHFGVPMVGAVLNALNTRLDPATIAFSIDHAEAKVFFVDSEFAPLAKAALAKSKTQPIVIDILDSEYVSTNVPERLGKFEFETLIVRAGPSHVNEFTEFPRNEWDALALNYTSGTTGNHKGVISNHRGAYISSLGTITGWQMPHHAVYLWTLPMFHCNGWCFPWVIAQIAGVNVCLRRVEAAPIYTAIKQHRVTHLCGAPIVMGILINASDELKQGITHTVNMMTAAAPPPAAVLAKMTKLGFVMTHVYGLTETYGPAVICARQDSWVGLSSDELAAKLARQGVPYPSLEGLAVFDPETMKPVQPNGEEMGEVMMRGNNVMKGYMKNTKANEESFKHGWFHSGDLAVVHPDGYIQLRDRSKDIIISGGENISSIEIEDVLYKHPNISLVAVVAKDDEKWGEVPCAFIELQPNATLTEADVIAFCRKHLAGFKIPKEVRFETLPKTSTGKVQKHVLRSRLRQPVPAKL